MPNPAVTHATFTIEREYPTVPERVFAAFSDPALKRRWFADGKSMDVEEFRSDFRAGGCEYTRTRFPQGSPFPGATLENHTVYQDILPGSRIVLAYTMSVAGNRISASLATFEIRASGNGSTLRFTEQAAFFEGADGAKMREDGWNQILNSLGAFLAA